MARGGSDFFECPPFCETAGAKGGNGGDAGAGATTTIVSGPAEAGATATGGGGGYGGGIDEGPDQGGGDGGFAGATATATTGSGSATASAIANGGYGGGSDGGFDAIGGVGGDASAGSTATAAGSGDASASASATGGAAGYTEFPPGLFLRQATPLRQPLRRRQAAGRPLPRRSRRRVFQAPCRFFSSRRTANATSFAETVNGAMAKALSTINPNVGEAAGTSEATAKTSFGGVSVQSHSHEYNLPLRGDY